MQDLMMLRASTVHNIMSEDLVKVPLPQRVLKVGVSSLQIIRLYLSMKASESLPQLDRIELN